MPPGDERDDDEADQRNELAEGEDVDRRGAVFDANVVDRGEDGDRDQDDGDARGRGSQ